MERIQKQSPALALLLKEKIRRFYSQNAIVLDGLNRFLRKHIQEYVTHGEDGKPLTEKKEDGAEHYVFETAEKEAEYIAKASEFMNRSIYVEI